MKAIVEDFYTTIFPTTDEIKELCRPGEGANTCVWLVAGIKGFECLLHNKPHPLLKRWQEGLTVAKRDGCEKARQCSLFVLGK